MTPPYVESNLNAYVRVKLNDKGREIHRAHFEPLYRRMSRPYSEPDVDGEGWSLFQLWDFMHLFGPHMGLGLLSPCDTKILIQEMK